MALKTAVVNVYIYTGTEGSMMQMISNTGSKMSSVIRTRSSWRSVNWSETTLTTHSMAQHTAMTTWVTARAALYDANDNELSDSPMTFTYLAVDGYGLLRRVSMQN